MSTPHPDFEALSAHHDGEVPPETAAEVSAHVTGCAACRTTLRWLRTTTTLVSTPVPPVSADVREDALARALEAFGGAETTPNVTDDTVAVRPGPLSEPASPVPSRGPAAVQPQPQAPAPRPDQPRSPTPIDSARSRRGNGSGMWVGVGSAAAVLVAFVLGVGLLTGGGGGRSDDTATVAADDIGSTSQERTASPPAGEAGSIMSATGDGGIADSGGAGGIADSGGAGGIDGGDLGELADGSALAAKARPVLLAREAEASGAPTATTARGVAGIAPAGPGPTSKFVGTRPCEMEIRTLRPELGTVVYFATGRAEGVPVVVLGFDGGPAPAPVTLLALAQPAGCRVVLEAAGP